MYSHNMSGVRQPGWAFSRPSGVSATPAGEHFSLQNIISTAYWDSFLDILRSTVKGNCLIILAEERGDYESGEGVWVGPCSR
jgi:hypothetical protein